MHYQRWHKGGDPGEAETRWPNRAPLCTEADCERCHYAMGLCEAHYNAANRGRILESKRRNYARHGDIARASSNAWYHANRDRVAERWAAYYAANRERLRDNHRRWRREHPELHRQQEAIRRAAKRGAHGSVYIPPTLLAAKVAFWGDRCWVCRGPWSEYDHVKPLAKGGVHIAANIRPICQDCNRSKKDRWPFTDWLIKRTSTAPPIVVQ